MNEDFIDILSVQEIRHYLENKLPQKLYRKLSEQILVYDSLESTNTTAREMAAKGAGNHGTVVIADFQSAGKGRCGKSFYSPAGHGLYISIILDPAQIGFTTPTLITAFAAVSVCDAIEAICDKTPQIKWVNDVFLDGKKICGILTEAVTDSENTAAQLVVLGIGINISSPPYEIPEDLKNIAGSLFGAKTPQTTRNHLAGELIYRILNFEYYQAEKEMLKKYRQKMFLLGKSVVVEGTDERYNATAVGIDDIGRLVVKTANGETLTLSSGEVSIRTES